MASMVPRTRAGFGPQGGSGIGQSLIALGRKLRGEAEEKERAEAESMQLRIKARVMDELASRTASGQWDYLDAEELHSQILEVGRPFVQAAGQYGPKTGAELDAWLSMEATRRVQPRSTAERKASMQTELAELERTRQYTEQQIGLLEEDLASNDPKVVDNAMRRSVVLFEDLRELTREQIPLGTQAEKTVRADALREIDRREDRLAMDTALMRAAVSQDPRALERLVGHMRNRTDYMTARKRHRFSEGVPQSVIEDGITMAWKKYHETWRGRETASARARGSADTRMEDMVAEMRSRMFRRAQDGTFITSLKDALRELTDSEAWGSSHPLARQLGTDLMARDSREDEAEGRRRDGTSGAQRFEADTQIALMGVGTAGEVLAIKEQVVLQSRYGTISQRMRDDLLRQADIRLAREREYEEQLDATQKQKHTQFGRAWQRLAERTGVVAGVPYGATVQVEQRDYLYKIRSHLESWYLTSPESNPADLDAMVGFVGAAMEQIADADRDPSYIWTPEPGLTAQDVSKNEHVRQVERLVSRMSLGEGFTQATEEGAFDVFGTHFEGMLVFDRTLDARPLMKQPTMLNIEAHYTRLHGGNVALGRASAAKAWQYRIRPTLRLVRALRRGVDVDSVSLPTGR